MITPKIYKTGRYFKYLLDYYNVNYNKSASQLTFDNFEKYNALVHINQIFSKNASGDIVDRTSGTPMPYQMTVVRPWRVPTSCLQLDQIFDIRITELEATSDRINIMWSGGIDSTVTVTAMLKHGNLKKYRVLYTPWSAAEFPGFYLLLAGMPDLELIDISTDLYLTDSLDGIFVTGGGGDGLTASLDESFFNEVGYAGLQQPWQDYFKQKTSDQQFLTFCEDFFGQSERKISTLLQARWWFYTLCKLQKFPASAADSFADHQPLAYGFFDFQLFEDYMYFNQDSIITGPNYSLYKSQLKDYIFSYYPDHQYHKYKIKLTSKNAKLQSVKKNSLNFRDYIVLLDTGERIRTPNLPFFNREEFKRIYQNRLDYLFVK